MLRLRLVVVVVVAAVAVMMVVVPGATMVQARVVNYDLYIASPAEGELVRSKALHVRLGGSVSHLDGISKELCMYLLWDKGSQRHCSTNVADIVRNGLDIERLISGDFMLVMVLTVTRFDRVLDTRHFSIAREHVLPSVVISWPAHLALTNAQVDIAFRVMNAQDADNTTVCLSVERQEPATGDVDGGSSVERDPRTSQRACLPIQQHVWSLTLPPGHYFCTAAITSAADGMRAGNGDVAPLSAPFHTEFDVYDFQAYEEQVQNVSVADLWFDDANAAQQWRVPSSPQAAADAVSRNADAFALATRRSMDDAKLDVVLHRVPEQQQPPEPPPEQTHIHNAVGAELQTKFLHVAIVSARAYDRYEEADTMLKSMLWTWDERQCARAFGGDIAGCHLVIHFIVDPGGLLFMNGLVLAALRETAAARELPVRTSVSFAFHRFSQVCERPVDELLTDLDVPLSSHYSGKAGYCRLFIPDFLAQYGVQRLVTVESDQLFFSSVHELFLHMTTGTAAAPFMFAAENYQPWRESRPPEDTKAESVAQSANIDMERSQEADAWGPRALDSACGDHGSVATDRSECVKRVIQQLSHGTAARTHSFASSSSPSVIGNGIIGGIMGFDNTAVARMRVSTAEDTGLPPMVSWWYTRLRAFMLRESRHGHWEPRLNDQDVFNAALSMDPHALQLLPCEWNVQFHARLNTYRLCGENELNCEASLRHSMFHCPARPKVAHFMTQAYRAPTYPPFFLGFWDAHVRLPWLTVLSPLLTGVHAQQAA